MNLNCIPVFLQKDDDIKKLFLFTSGKQKGKARDMSDGFGEMVDFNKVYKELKAKGYKEIN